MIERQIVQLRKLIKSILETPRESHLPHNLMKTSVNTTITDDIITIHKYIKTKAMDLVLLNYEMEWMMGYVIGTQDKEIVIRK